MLARVVLCLLAVVVGLTTPFGVTAQGLDGDLPDIGSPADSVLSKQREAQIGRQIFRSLRATERIIEDPEVQEYVQDLGQRIAANAQDGGFRFKFFVVDEPTINAFALPGGYIGIHSGLLLATENESELAGVVAHEVAHVTQRHISRAVYASQRQSILSMAAMLGAILVGAATGDSDVTTGAIATAQGLSTQARINFTRDNEYEADRVGVSVLAAAGFDPNGMASFFETMARRAGTLAGRVPEFLRTHPVTVSRISETRSRAAEYAVSDVQDSTSYSLIKARIKLLSSATPERALTRFEGELEDPKLAGDLGVAYGIALAKLRLGEAEAAQQDFETLLASNPEVISFHTGLGLAQQASGNGRAAEATLAEAMSLFPRNRPLTIRYASVLTENGKPGTAHKVLLDLYNQVPPTAGQVRQLALAASAAGDTADAHYYMAESHLLNGDLNLAADQLRLALSIPRLNDVQEARFRSRLEQVVEALPRQGSGRGSRGTNE